MKKSLRTERQAWCPHAGATARAGAARRRLRDRADTSTAAHPTTGGTLTIDNESGGLWTCGFNPFNAAVNFLSFGAVYEPLVYDNLLTDKRTPWLATAYQWSQGDTVLTFTTRPDVKWSDGQPFSAADVVYTFNLLKSNSALDLQSVWSVLSSVVQSGPDKVVMTFQQPAAPYFY
jgi:peptide/nickel transport system substrate-binding protein